MEPRMTRYTSGREGQRLTEMKSHASGAKIEGDGTVRTWWRLDLKRWHAVAATILAALAIVVILQGWMTNWVLTILDPHLRAVVNQQVPIAMSKFVDEAVSRFGAPHEQAAAREHSHLQQQIDEGKETDKRIEQQIIETTREQTQELRELRRELHEWMLKQQSRLTSPANEVSAKTQSR